LQTDVVLGLDWATHVRESLIGSGYHLDSTFDAWHFSSYPTHPPSSALGNPGRLILSPPPPSRCSPRSPILPRRCTL
jgi:hypothetical protein